MKAKTEISPALFVKSRRKIGIDLRLSIPSRVFKTKFNYENYYEKKFNRKNELLFVS